MRGIIRKKALLITCSILLLPLACGFLSGVKIIRNNDSKNLRPVPSSADQVILFDYVGEEEYGYGIAVDGWGNFYVSGYTTNFALGDLLLVKYNRFGVQQWNRTWGSSTIEEKGLVTVDNSGNAYLAGQTAGYGSGWRDMALVKYNTNGVKLWNYTWGYSDSGEYCNGIATDNSGNVYLVGSTDLVYEIAYEDAVIIKYNSDGVQLWNDTWGGDYFDNANGVCTDGFGNIYVSGLISYAENYFNAILIKYNSDGVQQWNKTWGGGDLSSGTDVLIDSKGNIYQSIDRTSLDPTNIDMVLVKYDSTGTQIWNKTWDASTYDYSKGISMDSNGFIYQVGYFKNSEASYSYDAIILKYDDNGTLLWEDSWGGSNQEIANDIAIDDLDNVLVVGHTSSYGTGDRALFSLRYVDTTNPVITSMPSDAIIEAGDNESSISWIATDDNPGTYTIELDGLGTVVGPTSWSSGVEITYTIPEDLSVGNNLYTINITDGHGNSVYDSVVITVEDTTDPMFTDVPSDFAIESGYTGVNISWTTTDLNPGTYTIELQGVGIIVSPTIWSSGSIIIYNIPDGLTEGEYLYTITVMDLYGNSNTHSVTMTIKSEKEGGAAIPVGYYYSIFLIIGIVTLLITQKRKIKKIFQ